MCRIKNRESKRDQISQRKGFTIIEITVVLAVLLVLIGIFVYSYGGYQDWKKGSEAGTRLRAVYAAQRTYLAEHPTVQVADVTAADIIPYLSGGAGFLTTAKPTVADLEAADLVVEDLDGNSLVIIVSTSPPTITGDYDPSGKDDGLWDVGN